MGFQIFVSGNVGEEPVLAGFAVLLFFCYRKIIHNLFEGVNLFRNNLLAEKAIYD